MPDDMVPLEAGAFVWYMKPGTTTPLPAKLLSDGICESKQGPTGLTQYAHLAHGTANPGHELLGYAITPVQGKTREERMDDTARVVSERQTHEVTAPWDPRGTPGTWHLDGEAEHIEHPARYSEPVAPESPSSYTMSITTPPERPKLKGPDDE